MRSRLLLVLLAVWGCAPSTEELRPATVSQRGGELLYIHSDALAGNTEGGVVVLIDGVPGNAVVIEAPGLVRVQVPSLPRTGAVDVELVSPDGTSTVVRGLEVLAPALEVRVRE